MMRRNWIAVMAVRHQLKSDINCSEIDVKDIDIKEWFFSIPDSIATDVQKSNALSMIKNSAKGMINSKPNNSEKTYSELNYQQLIKQIKYNDFLEKKDESYCSRIDYILNDEYNKILERLKSIESQKEFSENEDSQKRFQSLSKLLLAFQNTNPYPFLSMPLSQYMKNYYKKIYDSISKNIEFNDVSIENISTEVEISYANDGSILQVKLIRKSGSSKWDDAVLKAIVKTRQLPIDMAINKSNSMHIIFQHHP